MEIKRSTRLPYRLIYKGMLGLIASLCLLTAGCSGPEPRSFQDFMDDRIAREGTLARCNQDREKTARDIDCANARRAASTVALHEERARREDLERESERKLAALRAQIGMRDRARREAMAAALAAAEAAYEAQWAAGVFAEFDVDGSSLPTQTQIGGSADITAEAASAQPADAAHQFGAPIAPPAIQPLTTESPAGRVLPGATQIPLPFR